MREVDEVQGLIAKIQQDYDLETARAIGDKIGKSGELKVMFERSYNQILDSKIGGMISQLEREYDEETARTVTKTFAFHKPTKMKYLHRYAVMMQRNSKVMDNTTESALDRAQTG